MYSDDYFLAEGDSVIFEAEVVEYYELTELKDLVNLQVISSGNIILPNFCNTAAAGSEEFEGCFVEVSNAICNNDNAGFGEWIVNDGSGDLIIDDLFYAFTPVLNQSYNVAGVVTFSYGNFKLLPRNGSDVSGFISVSEISRKNIYIYPNPLNYGILNIETKDISPVNIYDFSGKLLYSKMLNKGINKINVDFLNKGLYFIKINSSIFNFSKI